MSLKNKTAHRSNEQIIEALRKREEERRTKVAGPHGRQRTSGKYAKPLCRICKVGQLMNEIGYMSHVEGYYVRRKICANPACKHKILTYELYPWCRALVALQAFQETPKISGNRRKLTTKRLAEALEALLLTGAYDRRGVE